eukprot:gb/GEZN01005826.1/.p1 GENE.gb/GEZN01005826.1/~~gb/GEZN01005826.1/.p1  ORF type:complete len:380 (+),score=29.52 gb/GEZN01005826.1/:600-1739(+)
MRADEAGFVQFVRVGGSVAQHVAIKEGASDVDLLFFIGLKNFHAGSKVAMDNLAKWVSTMDVQPIIYKAKQRVRLTYKQMEFDILITLNTADGLHPGEGVVRLQDKLLESCLSKTEAKILFSSWWAKVQEILKQDGDLVDSQAQLARATAKSYSDCIITVVRTAPDVVRQAIQFLKHKKYEYLQKKCEELPANPDIRNVVKKKFISSYGIVIIVLFQWQEMNNGMRRTVGLSELLHRVVEFIVSISVDTIVELSDEGISFYHPRSVSAFRKTEGKYTLYVRDPLNPANDVMQPADLTETQTMFKEFQSDLTKLYIEFRGLSLISEPQSVHMLGERSMVMVTGKECENRQRKRHGKRPTPKRERESVLATQRKRQKRIII